MNALRGRFAPRSSSTRRFAARVNRSAVFLTLEVFTFGDEDASETVAASGELDDIGVGDDAGVRSSLRYFICSGDSDSTNLSRAGGIALYCASMSTDRAVRSTDQLYQDFERVEVD